MSDASQARAERRARLADARLYLCTDARRASGGLDQFLHAVLAGGVDVVQLRDRSLDVVDELTTGARVRDLAHQHGALFAVNDRADLARALRADVLHTGQRDLPVAVARELVGPGMLLGRSSGGGAAAAEAAGDPDVDYFCVGPVRATPTKPGREPVGLAAVRAVADTAPTTPWFAIGGIDEALLPDVVAAGARRVVVVRALTHAPDPQAAAERLRDALRTAGEPAGRPGR
ncbi:thiamine phosphate synthase [Cellulomonas xiejunii]|uniref:Thiamine-phosphate synthase n=1 Tax=Cellulomonas xiejunii TaxID=2968083 RepID=A0ABY5KRR1_9CELL|nr:thiamine phosphate synthase [Cellulomonas xiejunii]MCC2322373.1 thiamine phosphate synthase [Cellulomonas xiejunii]UUI72423.1 thiamine phosphate synthase [Cellulomonas xiejunii]